MLPMGDFSNSLSRRDDESRQKDSTYTPGAGAECCCTRQTCPGHPWLHQSTRVQPDGAILANAPTRRCRVGCVADVFPLRRKPAASGGASTAAPAPSSGARWCAPLAPLSSAPTAPRIGVAGTPAWGSVLVNRPLP